MKVKHLLFFLPVLCAGNAFSQIENQITNAQPSANAWISGIFRSNTGMEVNAVPGTGGLALYNSILTTGSISNKLRWIVRGQNAEAGSGNAGYDFSIIRRADNGDHIGIPFQIARATGDILMPGVVTMGQYSTVPAVMKIRGTGSGSANSGWLAFYESDNTTRIGYVGDGSGSNRSIYLTADSGAVILASALGVVAIGGNASRGALEFSNTPATAPTFGTRSVGTKVVLHQVLGASQADFALGMETSNIWNSVPTNSTTYGFKWYGGTTQVARLDGVGNFETINSFKVGPVSGAESLSAKSNALAFNRNVNTNTNFTSTGHAYQFNHAASATSGSDRLDLVVYNAAGTLVSSNAFSVNGAGNIGMGVAPRADYKLSVDGTVGARKVKVTQETWADYVFESGYKLPTIAETEAFINTNKHLPGIPSAKEVTKEGIDVGEMNKLLLQKIEEQMLYIIEMNKEMKTLKEEVKELKKKKD